MAETTTKALLGHIAVDKKRIRVSSKRQITIPMKFHALLGMSNEVDCHIRNGALIITPIRPESTGEFAEEILADLVAQGYDWVGSTPDALVRELARTMEIYTRIVATTPAGELSR